MYGSHTISDGKTWLGGTSLGAFGSLRQEDQGLNYIEILSQKTMTTNPDSPRRIQNRSLEPTLHIQSKNLPQVSPTWKERNRTQCQPQAQLLYTPGRESLVVPSFSPLRSFQHIRAPPPPSSPPGLSSGLQRTLSFPGDAQGHALQDWHRAMLFQKGRDLRTCNQ